MDKTFEVDVTFHPHTPKNTFHTKTPIRGTLKFTPDTNMVLEKLGYEVIWEARGKMYGFNNTIEEQIFLEFEEVQAGKTLQFEFEFTVNNYETYNGINAELLIKFIPIVDIQTLGTEKFKSILSNLNPFSINLVPGTTYLDLKEPNYRLSPSPEPKRLSLNFLWNPLFIIIGMAVLLFASVHLEFSLIYVFMPVGILLAIIAAHYLIGEFMLGKTSVRFSLSESGNFIGYLENTRNWQTVKKLFTHLECTEKVVDRRGTTSSTEREVIFESEQLYFSRPKETIRLDFKVPEDVPPTMEIEDIEFYWTIKVIVDTPFRLSYTYESQFEVDKVKVAVT